MYCEASWPAAPPSATQSLSFTYGQNHGTCPVRPFACSTSSSRTHPNGLLAPVGGRSSAGASSSACAPTAHKKSARTTFMGLVLAL